MNWKLVPKEPTEAMHVAAVHTIVRCTGNDDFPPRVYRAMLAAAPEPPPQMTWQPIESAPRDGTWFVAAMFDDEYGPQYEVGAYDPLIHAQYEPAGDGLFRKVESIAYEWQGFSNFAHMTHWMPLPAPPTEPT